MAVSFRDDDHDVTPGDHPFEFAASSTTHVPLVHLEGVPRLLRYLRKQCSRAVESSHPTDSHGPSALEDRRLSFVIVKDISIS
jgi:hypothetical protein